MKSIVSIGKNVQKAIEDGLKELNATQDDVSIKIIDEGGLFRKAKVELTLDNYVEETEEKVEEKKPVKEVKSEAPLKEEKVKKQEVKKSKEEDKKEEIKVAKKPENKQDVETFCKEFLSNLFSKMKIEATVESYKTEIGITFNASGEKVSNLIGKRGETLNAIQEVLSNVAKNAGYRDVRVFFDVENYKNRREMSLITLAERMANKALKINKPIKLERMSAYERKIIHTALQDIEGVTSKSEGEEPNRRLVIIPTKKD